MAKRSKVGMTVETLGSYLREQRESAHLSLRQLAEQAGVSNPYLSQIERGLRRPSAEVLQQLAKALRISAEQVYVQAGILNPDDDDVRSVELAILGDPVLTERQKQSLLDVYESFRSTNEAHAAESTAGSNGSARAHSNGSAVAESNGHAPAENADEATTPDAQSGTPGRATDTEGN